MSDTNLDEAKKLNPSTISSSENPVNHLSTPSQSSQSPSSLRLEDNQNINVKGVSKNREIVQSEVNVSNEVKSNMIVSASSNTNAEIDQTNSCGVDAGHDVGGNEKNICHTSDKESSPERSHPTVGVSGLSSDTCSSVEFTWNEEVSRTNIVPTPEQNKIDTVHIGVPKVEIAQKSGEKYTPPVIVEKCQSSPSPPPLPPKIRHSKSAEVTNQPLMAPNFIRPVSPKRSKSHEFRENIDKNAAKVEPTKKLIPILKSPRQSRILFKKDNNNSVPIPSKLAIDNNHLVNSSNSSPKILAQKSPSNPECTKNKSVQTNDVSLSSSTFLAVPALTVPSSERSRSPHSPQHSGRRKARLSRKCKLLASSHVPATGSGPTSPYRQILTSSSSAEEDDEQLESGGYGGSGGGGGGGRGRGGCSKHYTGEDGEHSSSSGLLKAKSDESFDHYRASSSTSSTASRVGKRTQRYYRRKSQEFIFKPLNLVNPIRLADQRPSIEVVSSDSESDTGVIPCRISAPSNTVQWVQSRAYSPRTMERHAQEAKRIAEQNRLNSSNNTSVHHQQQHHHQLSQRLSSDAQYPTEHSASLNQFDPSLLDSAPYHSHVWTPARTCYNRQPLSVSSDPVASKRIDFRCLDDVLPEFSSSDPVIFPHHHSSHPINLSSESRLPVATSQPLHLNHHYHHLYQHLSPNNDSGVSSQSVASSPILSQASSPHLKLSTQKLSPPGVHNFSCCPEKPARLKQKDHVEQINQKADDMRPRNSSSKSCEQTALNSNQRSPFERINNVPRPRSQPEHMKDLDSKMMTIELRQSVKDLIGGIERGLKTANQVYKNLRNSKNETKIKPQTIQEEQKRTSPIVPAPRSISISNRSLSAFHTPIKSIDSNNNSFKKVDSNMSDRSLTKSQSFPLNDRSSTGLTNHVNGSIIKNGQSSRSIINSGKAFFEPTRREDFLNRMKFFERSPSSVPNQAKSSAKSLLLKDPVPVRSQNGHTEVNEGRPIVMMNQVNGHSSKVNPLEAQSNPPSKSTGKFVRLIDDQRNFKCAKSQSQNDLLNNSVKLDEALSELEEIYASLNLEQDEDLLDRAERRDIPSKFQLLRYQQNSNNCDQKLKNNINSSNNYSVSSQFKSYPPVEGKLFINSRPNSAQSETSRRLSIHENGDQDRPTPTPSDPGTTRCLIPSESGWNHPYCDNFSNRRSLGNVEAILAGYDPPYRQRTPPKRRSAIPDPVGDDLANRRMYQNPPPPQPDDDKKIPSYMLISPYYTPSSGGRDLLEEMANEPDIQKDDLSYRKYVQAQSAHMHIPSPHPPFGIPAGITELSTSNNYVNAQISEADKNWVYKRVKLYYPHLVKDDLAYRNYRKDSNRTGSDIGRESSPKLMPVTSKHLIEDYRINGRLPFASKNG